MLVNFFWHFSKLCLPGLFLVMCDGWSLSSFSSFRHYFNSNLLEIQRNEKKGKDRENVWEKREPLSLIQQVREDFSDGDTWTEPEVRKWNMGLSGRMVFQTEWRECDPSILDVSRKKHVQHGWNKEEHGKRCDWRETWKLDPISSHRSR